MQTRLAVVFAILTASLVGCTSGVPNAPVSPAPSASPSLRPIVSPGTLGQERLPIAHLPPLEEAVFGPVEALRQTDNELTLAYRVGENPYQQRFGLAGNAFLTLGGHEYGIHWDSADEFKTIAIGNTVNLHPTDQIICVDRGGEFPACYRMMRAYKGSRRIPPVTGR